MYFNGPIIHELNENLVLLEIQFKDKDILTYSYKEYFEEYKKDIESRLVIEFTENNVIIQFGKENKMKEILHDDTRKIENIKILDKFYGQILSIQSYVQADTLFVKFKNSDKLAIKYINYHDRKNFNIYNYFNGLKPFVPFPLLIRGLYENKQIEKIGGINKKEFLKNFVQKIFDVLVRVCDEYNIKTNIIESDEISVKKIAYFIIPLFFEIDFELLPEIDYKILEKNENVLANKKKKENILSLFFSKYKLHFLKKIMVLFYKKKACFCKK